MCSMHQVPLASALLCPDLDMLLSDPLVMGFFIVSWAVPDPTAADTVLHGHDIGQAYREPLHCQARPLQSVCDHQVCMQTGTLVQLVWGLLQAGCLYSNVRQMCRTGTEVTLQAVIFSSAALPCWHQQLHSTSRPHWNLTHVTPLVKTLASWRVQLQSRAPCRNAPQSAERAGLTRGWVPNRLSTLQPSWPTHTPYRKGVFFFHILYSSLTSRSSTSSG